MNPFDLKKCLHCGSEDITIIKKALLGQPREYFHVDCKSCGLRGPRSKTAKEATDAWDTLNTVREIHTFTLCDCKCNSGNST